MNDPRIANGLGDNQEDTATGTATTATATVAAAATTGTTTTTATIAVEDTWVCVLRPRDDRLCQVPWSAFGRSRAAREATGTTGTARYRTGSRATRAA
jgi:hypothetical protein